MALELWRKRASQESFSNNIFHEIDEYKEKLKHRIQSLRVMGDHHEANRKEEMLERIAQVEQSMKRLLEEA